MSQLAKSSPVAQQLSQMFFKPASQGMIILKQAIPKLAQQYVAPEAIVRAALTSIQTNPALQSCSPFSLINAIVEAAQAGLSLDVNLGQSFLVPYSGSAKLIYGYKGLIALVSRTGEVDSIRADMRYAKDRWKMTLGTSREIMHEPFDGKIKERGAAVGVYGVVDFRSGRRDFEYMSIDQVDAIRDAVLKRAKGKSSPWDTYYEEMARKTALRRLCKRLPQSATFYPAITAASLDERRDAGIETGSILNEPEYRDLTTVLADEGIDERQPGDERESVIKEKKPSKSDTISLDQARDFKMQAEEMKLSPAQFLKLQERVGHPGPIDKMPTSLKSKFAAALSEVMN